MRYEKKPDDNKIRVTTKRNDFMGDISADQKLELVRQIRNQYEQNQYDIRHRESVLYGGLRSCGKEESWDEQAEENKILRDIKVLRIALALMFIIAAVMFDQLKIAPLGIPMEQIFTAISENYDKLPIG